MDNKNSNRSGNDAANKNRTEFANDLNTDIEKNPKSGNSSSDKTNK